ncbi:cupin domain-containing protein (plasmid) [Rhizobium sp. CB3090]|uniref:cupin domain-containing protein n=1 Tax=Rhizobium sp. CB3090 TaxID=3039156 RepID=UPI0024B18C57|nr:cupin domain-containing protein [Rhizobium sp. CB3090]WFU12854.1 cupin domain-containing protein [Rhizobium sp. CB3090]
MYTKQIDGSIMRPEYGVLVCRLLEHLPQTVATGFGTSIVEVVANGAVDLHSHPEHELWVLISGSGVFEADGETTEVSGNTLLYIGPHQRHAIKNSDPETSLKFLSIWWD